jgi:Endomembrane protein 70
VDRTETLVFSYDVFFEKSEVEWTSRWDAYLSADAPNDKVQHSPLLPLSLSLIKIKFILYFCFILLIVLLLLLPLFLVLLVLLVLLASSSRCTGSP